MPWQLLFWRERFDVYLVTAEQMRQVDRMTIQELGIPEMVLMENAGKAVIDFLKETFADLQQKTVSCGRCRK